MGATIQKDRKIIDIFTMEEINLSSNLIVKCKELGLDYTSISKLLKGESNSLKARYIAKGNEHKIFTLVDVDSEEEYNCITNKSLFIQLKYPYTENECKYIYELKCGRQSNASICGRVFRLKGGIARRITNVKNKSNKIDELREEAYKRKIIKYRISKRIWQAIKDAGSKKDALAESLIGCNMQQFIKYISERFTEGMNWDNYGKFGWHLDHIKPCSSFDLKDKQQQKECFHYSNMQPIWGTTKIAKKYGFNDYIGNINKGDSEEAEDYYLTSVLFEKLKDMDKARLGSRFLVKKGIKKLVIR